MTTLAKHYRAPYSAQSVFRAVAAARAGPANRGGEIRVPGRRGDTDAVPEELQKWQAAG